jgi:hypothetical protein
MEHNIHANHAIPAARPRHKSAHANPSKINAFDSQSPKTARGERETAVVVHLKQLLPSSYLKAAV